MAQCSSRAPLSSLSSCCRRLLHFGQDHPRSRLPRQCGGGGRQQPWPAFSAQDAQGWVSFGTGASPVITVIIILIGLCLFLCPPPPPSLRTLRRHPRSSSSAEGPVVLVCPNTLLSPWVQFQASAVQGPDIQLDLPAKPHPALVQ